MHAPGSCDVLPFPSLLPLVAVMSLIVENQHPRPGNVNWSKVSSRPDGSGSLASVGPSCSAMLPSVILRTSGPHPEQGIIGPYTVRSREDMTCMHGDRPA